jgi:hypothetical protein
MVFLALYPPNVRPLVIIRISEIPRRCFASRDACYITKRIFVSVASYQYPQLDAMESIMKSYLVGGCNSAAALCAFGSKFISDTVY